MHFSDALRKRCATFVQSKSNLYQLWMLQKTMGIRPSKLLRINQWASELIGMRDCWTAYALDHAVMTFGIYIDNKLHERDDDGNPVNSLSELLDEGTEVSLHNNTVQGQMLAIMLGGGGG